MLSERLVDSSSYVHSKRAPKKEAHHRGFHQLPREFAVLVACGVHAPTKI